MKSKFSQITPYGVMTFGLFLSALGWTLFLIPAQIISGGVSGISALLYFVTGIPAGAIFLFINVFLIIIGLKILGKSFGIKTVYGILVFSTFLLILQKIIQTQIIKEGFMSAIIGGMMIGTGAGLVLSQGGSAGGTDIIAMIVNRYRNITPGKVFITTDIFIIASSYFVFHSLEKIIYAYVVMGVSAHVVDMVLQGYKQCVQVLIFSKMNSQIADTIGQTLGRGVTFLKGKGWYSHQEIEVVMVIIHQNELHDVLRIVKEIDPDAFLSVGTVMGVYGKGFDKLKY